MKLLLVKLFMLFSSAPNSKGKVIFRIAAKKTKQIRLFKILRINNQTVSKTLILRSGSAGSPEVYNSRHETA
jgi:hypothetical protein